MSLTLLIYPYAIYPLILFLFNKISRSNDQLNQKSENWPLVTLIISAYNEEQIIEQKLNNALALKYPAEKLEIIVISDASSDGTDKIVKHFSENNSNINLLRQNERRGKTAGLNLGVEKAKGDIVVFSDANAMYDKNSIQELVKYFANPQIGYVMGAALYNEDKESAASENEGLYWKFEIFVKKLETKFYSVVGGDGAIYAIRKELYWKLDDDDINDFVNPLQIVAKGYRGLFNPQAICYEDAAGDFKKEFKRKRRIVNRSWRGLTKYFGWFNIKEQYKFLFELFSHKVLRWFGLLFFIILIVSNLLIVVNISHPFYVITLIGEMSMIALGLFGLSYHKATENLPSFIYIPYYFLMAHAAALFGIIDEFMGIKHVTWEHVREGVE